ncbi:MAG: hypothetical protein Kilf2KO_31940 [Rhodospirillales bacterium]
MASTSLTLGPHWEDSNRGEVQSGRYGSASEVVRAALGELEERGKRLEALRAHLAEGAAQAAAGDFVVEASAKDVLLRAKARR